MGGHDRLGPPGLGPDKDKAVRHGRNGIAVAEDGRLDQLKSLGLLAAGGNGVRLDHFAQPREARRALYFLRIVTSGESTELRQRPQRERKQQATASSAASHNLTPALLTHGAIASRIAPRFVRSTRPLMYKLVVPRPDCG